MVSRVLMNLDVLLDLTLEPGWNGDYEDFDRRRQAMEQLDTLIEADQLVVYVPPFIVCLAHMQVMIHFGAQQAQHVVHRILELASTHLSLDYERLLEQSNTASNYFGGVADLYDVMLLSCGWQLNVEAIVARRPQFFHQLMEANQATFAGFNIPILTAGALVNLISETRLHDPVGEMIYAITPQNRVINLPQGATPIDFAYKIHTKLGNRCISALVNGREVSLDRRLKTGDVVEILKDTNATPNPAWLTFVVTRTAKQGIQRGLKQVNTQRGWRLIKQVLGRNIRGYRPKLEQVARLLNRLSVDDLMSTIGSEEISIQQLQELLHSCNHVSDSFSEQRYVQLENSDMPGSGEQSWRVALCCTPLPGDPIVGVVASPKRSMRIHRATCANLRDLSPEKLRPLIWNTNGCRIQIQLTLADKPDIFRPILNKLVENAITPDLRSVNIFDETAKATIGMTITSRAQLEEVLSQISSLPHVLHVKLARPVLDMPNSVRFQ
ncbi:TGS domain-containing protein [Thermocoleostomius sinensis]|uniref:TGS domain-containing protein n=1 Tax=Thermocoleostomius sinensis A174 TaxID=2016057 RepID=A0A9E8ZH16_9CYAN|nr:TGS domain-containing protein [Thermocoleostomius sinensis]WAL61679.1 TGS domain-containing protein [Thermocoleostomius sinensis A174]